MDNLEEVDKFWEKHNLLRLKQEETENINRPITSTEMETLIINLPTLRLLLLWNPLQTGSFIHYLIIGLGQHIQIWYSFSLKYKKFYQALRLFLCSGSAKYSQLFSLYRGYPHLPQTTAPLTTYLCGRSLNFHEFYVTSLWQACAF